MPAEKLVRGCGVHDTEDTSMNLPLDAHVYVFAFQHVLLICEQTIHLMC